ncbi:MAG: hypothetical protein JWM59_771 [Verrucomicrobiales bacterium]|nr:hypothetical protein [Verrucomicrobiales bacterium]
MLGSNKLQGPSIKFLIGELEFLRFDANSDPDEPWNLTGSLSDGAGAVVHFERNNVLACSGNWDVELEGQLLTFRRGARNIVLQLKLEPDQIVINLLNLKWPSGFGLKINSKGRLEMENLKHSEYNNTLNYISYDNVTISYRAPLRILSAGNNSATITVSNDCDLSGLFNLNSYNSDTIFVKLEFMFIQSAANVGERVRGSHCKNLSFGDCNLWSTDNTVDLNQAMMLKRFLSKDIISCEEGEHAIQN